MRIEFKFYRCFYKSYLRLKERVGDEAAYRFLEVIMDYVFDNTLPPEDDIIWVQGALDVAFDMIDYGLPLPRSQTQGE